MVTKGIIKSIDLKGNTCTVHMPFFETAGNDPIIGTAIISNTPGSYNGYKVGDVVLVAFEDGAMETPVVIGKLYLGAEAERADPRGVLNVENSTVSKSATMPADTKLAAQIDSNVPNTTVPYGSLSSIANELNTLNTNVGQMDRDYGNRFKQVITSIGEQGEDLSSKIEQSATEISAEVSRVETDLDGKIAANSAAIKVNADSITESVTEINKTIDGKVTELEGKIETTSSGITASVTEQFKTVEQNIIDLGSDVDDKLAKKIDLENKGLSQKGFGWKVDNESWTIKAFDQNNEGSLPEDGLDIFKITRDEVVINTPYVTLSGYPKDTIIRYAQSDSTIKHPDAYIDANKPHTDKNNISTVWTEEIPAWEDGKYIWRWTQVISYEYDKDYKSSTGSTGAWNKVSASDRFECLAGASAVSLWLNCSTTTHAGSQQKEKIEIIAMAKVGTGDEKEDTAATLEYRWGLEGELISANSHNLVIENTKNTPILDKNLIIIAKRNGKVYTSATIYFSPLNTPILILSGDSASIAYNSYGDTKIDEKACVKIEAKVLLNNKEMSNVTYSWKLDDCTNDTNISESTSWDTTITNIDNISIYHIAEASSYATVACTATYKDNLGNETELEKTFTITKNLQGKSQYKLDIFNEFITFPVNYDTIEINTTNTLNITALTTHEVSALYGDTPVEFISYIEGSAPDTFEAKQFYLKVVPSNNITLNPDIVYSNTLRTKLENNITKLNGEDQTTGYITYELYRGSVKVASAKFEASMIHSGTPVTRSWLVIDKLIHTGTTETKTITAQPKIETGNSGADNDLTATIECRYLGEVKPDGTLGAPSSIPSKNNVAKDENNNPTSTYFECNQDTKAVTIFGPFKNQDIEIKAKHGTSVYETEIITYIPQDTPGLDLDNDGDFIPYTPSGNKIGTSTVKSRARLLLNQEEISGITYTWTLDGCVLKNDENEVKLTTFTGPTIEIEYLTKERATATCKVSYLGKEYSKTFSIVKQISAASYWVAVSQPVHSGAEQDIALTACAKKNEGLVVEADDERAILWYRFKNDTTWTTPTSKFKLEIAKTSFKDQDLYIIATHDSSFEPDEDTVKTEDDIYAWETIMFSSSTPALNFEPDVGFIIYDAENTKINADNNKAIVTAGLYKNGLLLPANEVTYTWTPESCSGEQDSSNLAKYTVNEIETNVNIAKVKCEATYAGRKYTNEFTVIKQINATTYWIKTSCFVHKGAEQQQNISIIAMRKDGTNPETQDNLAYLWWKYESATAWTQVTGAAPYAITIEAGKEASGTGKIKPEDILVLATHKASFNPNAENVNILTDENIYDQETIEYSPLDTPTINLDEDRGALVYDADGNKIGNTSAETTAAIWYNGERLDHSSLDYTYSWTYDTEKYTCKTEHDKNNNGVYLEVSEISTESVTFTCKITIGSAGIDGNGAFANKTYTKNFTVVRQIKGDPTIVYDILPSVKQLKARANSELYAEYGDNITFNIIKSRGLETPKAINYTDESEATLTVKIAKDGGNLEEYSQDPDSSNTYTISLLKTDGKKITNSIIIELYNNNVLIRKVTVDVIKDGADGDAANSYWISCPRQHLGKNNSADISVKAYKQIGNEVSTIDTEAWLRYRVKSTEEFSEWFAINELENNTLIISKSDIENENIIIQAAHLITSDGASIYNEYDEEIIDYTPLNTPTLVIDGDRHVIRYLLNGNDLENITGNVVSIAAVKEGLTELTNITYSWSVKNSSDSNNITFSGQNTNTITISDIKTNRVVITCTATVNDRFDDLGNAFVVQKEITVDKEVLTSNYRLKISTPIHTGATQLDNIKVEALATLGNESEKPDEKAYLRYSLDNGETWENESEDSGWIQDSTLEISASSCADSNIIIQYTHDKNTILENETITYSPLNTPVIDLTNDTASIAYDVEGNKIEEDDFAVSVAKVWLNGRELKAIEAIDENTSITYYTYYWLLENCTAEDSKTQSSEGTTYDIVESNFIKVLTLTGNTNTAKAIFKVKFTNGTYAGLELEKEFTISKQIKGDKGDKGEDAISPYIIDIANDNATALSNTSALTGYDWPTNTKHNIKVLQGITPIKASNITVKKANEYTPAATDSLILTYELINITSIKNESGTDYEKVYSITGLTDKDLLKGEINYTLYNQGSIVATAKFKFSTVLYGVDGVSITGVDNYYYAGTKSDGSDLPSTENPGTSSSSWVLNITDTQHSESKPYLWNIEVVKYSDGTSGTPTAPALLGYWSVDGKGIESITEYYQINNSTTISTPAAADLTEDNGWYTIPPTLTGDTPYLWNVEKITFTKGDPKVTEPVIVGTFSRSITEVKNYYLATKTDSNKTNPLNNEPAKDKDGKVIGWKESINDAGFNAINKYLWNYEEIFYDRALTAGGTDKSKTTAPEIISTWSKSIDTIKEFYLISKSNNKDEFEKEENANGDWSNTAVAPDSTYPYLWNKEATYYTDAPTEAVFTSPVIIGTYGETFGINILSSVSSIKYKENADGSKTYTPETLTLEFKEISGTTVIDCGKSTKRNYRYKISKIEGSTTTTLVPDSENTKLTDKNTTINFSIKDYQTTGIYQIQLLLENNGEWVVVTTEDIQTIREGNDGRDGADATSYWIKMDSNYHLGTRQTNELTIRAMKKIGTSLETVDTDATLWWFDYSINAWHIGANKGQLNFAADKIIDRVKNNNLHIIATHKDKTELDFSTETSIQNAASNDKVYDSELIDYLPPDTLVLLLDNDSDSISYSSANSKLNDSTTVSSTATLAINGDNVENTEYIWVLANCKTTNTAYLSNSNIYYFGDTITINELEADRATATCRAFINRYTISAIVERTAFTDAAWDLYGTVDHEEPWGSTTSIDSSLYFIIWGKSTDTGKLHVLWYESLGAGSNGQLFGKAVAHDVYAEKVFSIAKQIQGDSIVKTSKQYLLLKDLKYSNVRFKDGKFEGYIEKSKLWEEITEDTHYNLFTEDFQADLFKEYDSDKHKIFVREEYTYSSGTITYSEFREEKVVEEVFALKQGKSTNYYGPVDPAGTEGSFTYGDNMIKGDCWFDTDNYGYELDPEYTSFTTAEKYIGYYLKKVDENDEISYIEITETNLLEMVNNTNIGKEEAYKKVLQPTLKQWSVLATYDDGSSTYGWKDIGGEIVENKVTANYINAMDITAKRIEILDTDNNPEKPLFKADGLDGKHEVNIAGFTVEANTLTAGTASNNTYVQLGTEAIMLGGDSTDTAPFSVTNTGYLTATLGEIGGFNISSTSITSGDKVGKTLDAGANLGGVYIGPDGISIGKGFKVTAGEAGNTEITLSDTLMNELKAATYNITSNTNQVIKNPNTGEYSHNQIEFQFFYQLGHEGFELINADTTEFKFTLNGEEVSLNSTDENKDKLIIKSENYTNTIDVALYLSTNTNKPLATKTVSIISDGINADSPYTLDIINDRVSCLTSGGIPWTSEEDWKTNTTHKIKVLHGATAIAANNIEVKKASEYNNQAATDGLVLTHSTTNIAEHNNISESSDTAYEKAFYIKGLTSEADKGEIVYTLYYRGVAVASAKFEFLKVLFGTNGRSIESVTNYYFATTTNSSSLLPPKTALDEATKDPEKGYWQKSLTETGFGKSKPYLWNFEQIKYDQGDPSSTNPENVSYWASDGKGISEIIELYQLTESADIDMNLKKPSTPENADWKEKGWSKTIQQPNASNPYLWNIEITIYNNDQFNITNPAIIGTYGESFGANIIPAVSSINRFENADGTITCDLEKLEVTFTEVSGTETKACSQSSRSYKFNAWIEVDGQKIEASEMSDTLTKEDYPASIAELGIYADIADGHYVIQLYVNNGKDDKSNEIWVLVDSENIPIITRKAANMTCVIESSAGTSFKWPFSDDDTTTLTAHLYEGLNEVDSEHEWFYEWYWIDLDPSSETYNKVVIINRTGEDEKNRGTNGSYQIKLKLSELENNSIHFIAYPHKTDNWSEETDKTLGVARLGTIPIYGN